VSAHRLGHSSLNTIAKIKGLMRWVGDFELAYLMNVLKCDFADLIAVAQKPVLAFQKIKKSARAV
jgi:hypothetical protein